MAMFQRSLGCGQDGGFLGELFEEITRPDHILASYHLVREKYYDPFLRVYLKFVSGIDGVNFTEFDRHLEESLGDCQRFLLKGNQDFHPIILRKIPKDVPGKFREIYLLSLRDRILQRTLADALSRRLDRYLYPNLYSYRSGKHYGTMAAARKVRIFLQENKGRVLIFKTDIKNYFDSMDHSLLLRQLSHHLPDESEILALMERFVHQRRCFDGIFYSPIQGIPTGSSLSPFCANLFLADLDARMFRGGHIYVRYGDDILLLSTEREKLQRGRAMIEEELAKHGLCLSKKKTNLSTDNEPLDYLGYRFENGRVQVGATAVTRFRKWILEQLPRYRYQNEANKTASDRKALLGKILQDLHANAITSLNLRQVPWLKGFPIVDDDMSIRALDRFIKDRIRLCVVGKLSPKNYQRIPEHWFHEAGYRSLNSLYYRITRRRPIRLRRTWQSHAIHRFAPP